VDLNLQRSGGIFITREREKNNIERAETARSGPSSARPAQLDCTRTLTGKKGCFEICATGNPTHARCLLAVLDGDGGRRAGAHRGE
jgi:hypothetical protein